MGPIEDEGEGWGVGRNLVWCGWLVPPWHQCTHSLHKSRKSGRYGRQRQTSVVGSGAGYQSRRGTAWKGAPGQTGTLPCSLGRRGPGGERQGSWVGGFWWCEEEGEEERWAVQPTRTEQRKSRRVWGGHCQVGDWASWLLRPASRTRDRPTARPPDRPPGAMTRSNARSRLDHLPMSLFLPVGSSPFPMARVPWVPSVH